MFKRIGFTLASLLLLSSKGVTEPLESFYCVQVLSSSKVTKEERRLFEELSRKFKGVRVEKIGNYYTLRVGFWRDISQARKALRDIRREGAREAFLRRCYYLPKRWVLPRVKKRVESPRLTKKRREKTKEQLEIVRLVEFLIKEKELPKGQEEKALKISFPESRKRVKREPIKVEFGISINRELSRSYTFTQLTYKKVGVRALKEGKEKKVGVAIKELPKELWLKGVVFLRLGILKRENYLESWSPLSLEASSDFVDREFSLSLSYQGFRNYENQINLKGLFSLSAKGSYHFSTSSGISLWYLYDKFTNKRELSFSKGSRFNIEGWKGNFSSFLSLKGDSYLLTLKGKIGNLEVSLFKDNSLGLPPQAKGELYLGRQDFFFAIDPKNLKGINLKVLIDNLTLSSSMYLTKRGKEILVGTKEIDSKRDFGGIILSARYTLNLKNGNLHFGGGLFFPGSAFEDRKPKTGGYLDVKVSW